jgi:hypothetical protein
MNLPSDVWMDALKYASSKSDMLKDADGFSQHIQARLAMKGWVQTKKADPSSWVLSSSAKLLGSICAAIIDGDG